MPTNRESHASADSRTADERASPASQPAEARTPERVERNSFAKRYRLYLKGREKPPEPASRA